MLAVGLAYRRADGAVLVADENNHSIRQIRSDGLVSTIAGHPPFPHNSAVSVQASAVMTEHQPWPLPSARVPISPSRGSSSVSTSWATSPLGQHASSPSVSPPRPHPRSATSVESLLDKVERIRGALELEPTLTLRQTLGCANEMMGLSPPPLATLPSQADALLAAIGYE